MTRKLASHILKLLLILFLLGSLFMGFYVMPMAAEELASLWPEIAFAKGPLLFGTQALTVLLGIGVLIILYLLRLFDQGRTFSANFVRGTEILAVMCLVAAGTILWMLGYLGKLGGPGPGGIYLLGLVLAILIVGMVILLIRTIVLEGMELKHEVDLTI